MPNGSHDFSTWSRIKGSRLEVGDANRQDNNCSAPHTDQDLVDETVVRPTKSVFSLPTLDVGALSRVYGEHTRLVNIGDQSDRPSFISKDRQPSSDDFGSIASTDLCAVIEAVESNDSISKRGSVAEDSDSRRKVS